MTGELGNLIRHGALIRSLVIANIKGRYVSSFMGVLWSVIHPLIVLAVYTLLFAVFLKVAFAPGHTLGDFALYAFCGTVPWLAFSSSVSESTSSVVGNGHLIRNFIFPSKVFPFALTLSGIVHQMVGTVILVVAILCWPMGLKLTVVLFPALLVLQFIFTLGLSWALAAVNVYFRDTEHLVRAAMPVWMLLSCIYYPPAHVPGGIRHLLYLNPWTCLVEAYRNVMLDGALPSLAGLSYVGLTGIVLCFIGYLVFERLQPGFADLV